MKPGMTVVEIGSNIGTHTVPLAKIVGSAGKVFAYEPQRIIFQMLCSNIALNSLRNVWAFQKGLSDKEGTLCIPLIDYDKPNNFGGVPLALTGAETVPVGQLDSEGVAPQFIKIDAEGMEIPILIGATKTITRNRPIIYTENDRESSEALIGLLKGMNYDLYWHTPYLFNQDNWFKNKDNIYGNIISINMLCVPSELHLKVEGLKKVENPNWRSAL